MACFLAPAAEAVVVTVVAQVMISGEKKASLQAVSSKSHDVIDEVKNTGVSFARKLMWLAYLLWGGCFLLAYEHLWHGEVVPFFPFLTAMNDPGETQIMLSEIASVGGSMCIFLTLVWALMLVATARILRERSPLNATA